MRNTFEQNIFNSPHQSPSNELDFIEVQEFFQFSYYNPFEDFRSEPAQLQFDSFTSSPDNRDSTGVDLSAEPVPPQQADQVKPPFQSSYSKNVCYNICQKTIKVIKKSVFDLKLAEICQRNSLSPLKFKADIVGKKKDFTGPKALQTYLERETSETRVFAEFMRWFLTEKYLRMAINEGEMKNLKVYIDFKNTHILPLLG